ncbi:MAG TPA: zinc-finger domain-containing protein [Stellaceae bacterium]|nr:zinc-finger domain-containing protein [Stellaceae bacterium]
MPAFETIETAEMVVACNGGGGPLGHPRVYLNLAPLGRIECPYCSRQFVNRAVVNGAGAVAEEVGVIMPSTHGPGQERLSESPAPRQVGDVAAGGEDG